MGKIFRRGEVFYADLRDVGRGKVTLKTTDRTVAKARLRDLELGTTGQAPHAAKELRQAVDDMVKLKRATTAAAYREKALHLFRLLGPGTDINTLTRARVAEYATARLGENAHRHSIHKELVVLRQALKESRERDEFVGNLEIVPRWKAEYEPRRRWLTKAEFGRLMKAVGPSRQTWLMIQLYTGAELGAMRGLTWDHVNMKRRTISIPGTKRASRYRADLPMHPQLRAWLARLDTGKPLVAPWPKVHRDFREACARAKIDPPVTTHDLRRTFGSWLVQAGVDIQHVARMMGNTYGMVARVYGQTSDASFAAAIKKLPRV